MIIISVFKFNIILKVVSQSLKKNTKHDCTLINLKQKTILLCIDKMYPK